MPSERSGKTVANQFIVEADGGRYFQSHSTTIAFIDKSGKVFLDTNTWNYSRTTAKYRNKFLGMTTKETEAKIESGEIELINLNK